GAHPRRVPRAGRRPRGGSGHPQLREPHAERGAAPGGELRPRARHARLPRGEHARDRQALPPAIPGDGHQDAGRPAQRGAGTASGPLRQGEHTARPAPPAGRLPDQFRNRARGLRARRNHRRRDRPVTVRAAPDADFRPQAWIEAFHLVARQYGLPVSTETARLSDRWLHARGDEERIRVLARHAGLQVHFADPASLSLTSWRLPIIVRMHGGDLAVITAVGASGEVSLAVAGEAGLQQRMELAELVEASESFVVPRPAGAIPDARVDTYIRPYEEHWLRRILL